MIVADWRNADANVLRSCYDREALHWQRQLGWETEQTWSTVEEARVTWGLPGLLALDGARVDGWAFFTRDDDMLQVGGLVSETGEATAKILDEVLKAATHAELPTVSCFLLDRAADLRTELTKHGFEVEPFLYLAAPLSLIAGPSTTGASWREGDVDLAGDLLHAAYSPHAARHFAPHGTTGEWRHYISNMVEQTACGVFDPHATRVVRQQCTLRALALMTSISPRTAHLAQMVVHPNERGKGVAGQLLKEAAAIAASAGREEMTLLVSESNQPARHLYERLGFTPRAHFVAARR
jgi:ribosomal protein S18 acetylase RimI-like enzyme